MYCVKKLQEDLYWVGASDRRLALFENIYPISRGVSYNAYVVLDENTALMDTADPSVSSQFLLKLYGFFFREMNFFASMAVDDENFLAVHQ